MAAGLFVERVGLATPDYSVVIEATGAKSPGIRFVDEGEFAYMTNFDGDDANPYDIKDFWEARFGILTPGTKIFVRSCVIMKGGFSGGGLASAWIEGSAIVDA